MSSQLFSRFTLSLCSAVLVGACATTGAPQPSSAAAAGGGGASYAEASATSPAGHEVFDRNCGSCHPGGEADLGPSLMALGWDHARMISQIREGSGRMRPISAGRMSDEQLASLMDFLQVLGSVR